MSDRATPTRCPTDWQDPGTAIEGGVEVDMNEIIRQLNAELGPTLVSAVAGSRDPDAYQEGYTSIGPCPTPEMIRRLRFAYVAWVAVAAAEGDDVARIWFIGSNPLLGGDTPIDAIREGRFRETETAVAAFVHGGFAGRPST
jgi:hypothetical protein